jgi:acyl carrier protein
MRTARLILRFIHQELLEGVDVEGDPVAQGLLDSLAREQLAAFLEERFGVRLEIDELTSDHLTSVDRLADLVDARRMSAT